jgi:hypothetical protein
VENTDIADIGGGMILFQINQEVYRIATVVVNKSLAAAFVANAYICRPLQRKTYCRP